MKLPKIIISSEIEDTVVISKNRMIQKGTLRKQESSWNEKYENRRRKVENWEKDEEFQKA